ncbi:hypothetical protein PR048_014338 [Dryococelus australis]|uniref:Uncharacterized protein n=1 Tax=Dryococelus australis TaxID=614101 RepID=A0ABQ9HDX0_9NEOP|nr:hypothetical protein PR048_014338 [Dryococelus australis]
MKKSRTSYRPDVSFGSKISALACHRREIYGTEIFIHTEHVAGRRGPPPVPHGDAFLVVVTPLESRSATSCGYNSSHSVWHALYECLQDIHGDSSPFILQPFHEFSNGFWPRLTSPHPAIQFVSKMFYRVEVGALGGPVQSANIVIAVLVCLHGYPEPCCLQCVLLLLKGAWQRRQMANTTIEVVPTLFYWIEIGAVWEPGKNFEVLIMLFASRVDISIRASRRIIVLEGPILPRNDNHHVRVDVIDEDGFITKSIKSTFHMDYGTYRIPREHSLYHNPVSTALCSSSNGRMVSDLRRFSVDTPTSILSMQLTIRHTAEQIPDVFVDEPVFAWVQSSSVYSGAPFTEEIAELLRRTRYLDAPWFIWTVSCSTVACQLAFTHLRSRLHTAHIVFQSDLARIIPGKPGPRENPTSVMKSWFLKCSIYHEQRGNAALIIPVPLSINRGKKLQERSSFLQLVVRSRSALGGPARGEVSLFPSPRDARLCDLVPGNSSPDPHAIASLRARGCLFTWRLLLRWCLRHCQPSVHHLMYAVVRMWAITGPFMFTTPGPVLDILWLAKWCHFRTDNGAGYMQALPAISTPPDKKLDHSMKSESLKAASKWFSSDLYSFEEELGDLEFLQYCGKVCGTTAPDACSIRSTANFRHGREDCSAARSESRGFPTQRLASPYTAYLPATLRRLTSRVARPITRRVLTFIATERAYKRYPGGAERKAMIIYTCYGHMETKATCSKATAFQIDRSGSRSSASLFSVPMLAVRTLHSCWSLLSPLDALLVRRFAVFEHLSLKVAQSSKLSNCRLAFSIVTPAQYRMFPPPPSPPEGSYGIEPNILSKIILEIKSAEGDGHTNRDRLDKAYSGRHAAACLCKSPPASHIITSPDLHILLRLVAWDRTMQLMQTIEVFKVDESGMRLECSSTGMKRVGIWEIPGKTRRPVASSYTITTCENPVVTWPGIKQGFALTTHLAPRRTGLDTQFSQTMPLVGGFSRASPVSPALSFQRCSILTSITLIASQNLAFRNCRAKSRPERERVRSPMRRGGCWLPSIGWRKGWNTPYLPVADNPTPYRPASGVTGAHKPPEYLVAGSSTILLGAIFREERESQGLYAVTRFKFAIAIKAERSELACSVLVMVLIRPIPKLILHKAEEHTTCINVDLKQGFQKFSFYREQPIRDLNEWRPKHFVEAKSVARFIAVPLGISVRI